MLLEAQALAYKSGGLTAVLKVSCGAQVEYDVWGKKGGVSTNSPESKCFVAGGLVAVHFPKVIKRLKEEMPVSST